jgi:hypothetical protein
MVEDMKGGFGHCGCCAQPSFHLRIYSFPHDPCQAGWHLLDGVVLCQIFPGVVEWFLKLILGTRLTQDCDPSGAG